MNASIDNKSLWQYNSTMIDVIIKGACGASDAAAWCLDNLASGQWHMEVVHFCTPAVRYKFSFLDQSIATFVSLKFA